jgi:two-component system chemotaxis response regulator CheB
VNSGPTRILIVDDSALYRQSIHNVLREVANTLIVGTAANGIDALGKIEELDPDLLTLDVQMPDMNGIEVLHEIKRRALRPQAIMVSSLTCEGAQVTTDALMEGAFDFILKPSGSDTAANRQMLRDALDKKIAAFRDATTRRKEPRARRQACGDLPLQGVTESAPAPRSVCRVVIVGTSTGGPEALKIVLPRIRADFQVPILVVQHMPAQYTASLAKRLDAICELDVTEAQDQMVARAGTILVAPGGEHMRLEAKTSGLRVRLTDDPPEQSVRPSINYLLRSVCQAVDGNALAIIMTGMGRDGEDGCRQLKQVGGFVFAQHQEDCVVYGMPKAVIDAGLADRVLPLGKIAPAIARHIHRSRRS